MRKEKEQLKAKQVKQTQDLLVRKNLNDVNVFSVSVRLTNRSQDA